MIKFLSSSRITVISIFLLFILTFWGTIAQVEQGLFASQERFFNSFFFLAAGFIPFPGAQLILWVLFINLICVSILQYKKYCQWHYAGILITHIGLLIYFIAAFMVFHVSEESNIHFRVGEETNVSKSYIEWELSIWSNQGQERKVSAFDSKFLIKDYKIPYKSDNFELIVQEFYQNSEAYDKSKNEASIINGSGIGSIIEKPVLKEREQNIAAGIFRLKTSDSTQTLILSGIEYEPTQIKINGEEYSFILRRKQFQLPFSIRLDDFKAEFHSGTAMAKNYESVVTITTGGFSRQARIFMNNPLKYKDYTLYQSSYNEDKQGRKYTTLAVVRNYAKFLPYVACLVVFFGLALHFLIQAFMAKVRR